MVVTAPITAATIASLPYNGNYQAPTTANVTSVTPAGATFTVNATAQKDANTYTATVSGLSPYTGSVTANWQITAIGQTINFSTPANQTCGGTLTLGATASSGLPITYSNVSGATLNGNILTFDQGPGTVSVTANQGGNVDYSAATPQTVNFQAVATTTTFALSATSFTYNGSIQQPTVIVTPSNATVHITGTTSATDASTNSITAQAYGAYTGNSVLQWTINPAPQTVSFSTPTTQYSNAVVTLSATASSGLPVSFSVQGGPGSVSGNTLTFSGGGTVIVRASQSGNQDYLSNYKDVSITVTQLISASYTLAQSSLHYTGSPLSPTIVPSPAGATNYTVTGTSSATAIGGPYSMTVTSGPGYSGQSVLTWYIAAATQTISFSNPGTPKTYGDVLTLTATASSGLPVSFRMDSGTGTFSGAQLNILTLTSAGSSVVTAFQNGNSNYAAAPIQSYPITVNKATPVGTFAARTLSPANGASGYIVTAADLNATFAHPSNGSVAAPSGTTTYTIGTGSPSGSVGSSVAVGTILPLGTYYISANYPGDTNYNITAKTATWTIDVSASIASQLHLTHPSSPPQNDSSNSTGLIVHKP